MLRSLSETQVGGELPLRMNGWLHVVAPVRVHTARGRVNATGPPRGRSLWRPCTPRIV